MSARGSQPNPYCPLGRRNYECRGNHTVDHPNQYCDLGLRLCNCLKEKAHLTDVASDQRILDEGEEEQRSFDMCGHDILGLFKKLEQNEFVLRLDNSHRAMRPLVKDHHHQDSLFGNSFQSKSFFVVHPEWLSEVVDNTEPEPLHRPPWPWEQPRYRQNIQIPITYKPDEQPEVKEPEPEPEPIMEQNGYFSLNSPLMPYSLPRGYTFTHPGIDQTRPFEKQTQFGAPVVDTSSYKLDH